MRWNEDKNNILFGHGENYVEQLPGEMIDKMLKNFLFRDFMIIYHREFEALKRDSGRIKHARYMWEDEDYHTFMIEIISKLEPIEFEAKQTIFDELEEVNEIVFLINTHFQVGFTINNKKYFKL